MVILLVMLGTFTDCSNQKFEDSMIDALAIDFEGLKKHPDADRKM